MKNSWTLRVICMLVAMAGFSLVTAAPGMQDKPKIDPLSVQAPATTLSLNNSLAAGTYEVLPAGTAAAITEMNLAMQKLALLTLKQNPPIPGPIPSGTEKRLDALENGMLRLADSILNLQKLIEGKGKNK